MSRVRAPSPALEAEYGRVRRRTAENGGERRRTAENGRERQRTAENGRERQRTAENGRERQRTAENGSLPQPPFHALSFLPLRTGPRGPACGAVCRSRAGDRALQR